MTANRRHPVRRAAVSLLGLLALLVILGSVLGGRPATAEDGVNRTLAAHRDGFWDSVSSWVSAAGSTPVVVGVTVLCLLALLILPGQGRGRGRGEGRGRRPQAAFLGFAVAVQSLVFLLTTVCVERRRPGVVPLDVSPPTSSFPSGHTGAALALYGGLAVLAHLRLRRPWRAPVVTLLLLLPLLVGASRLYRGMHHPTDVAAALLNGAVVLYVSARLFLPGRDAPHPGSAPEPAAPPAVAGTRVAVVVNPLVTDHATREQIRAALERAGYREPEFTETTEADSGARATARAVRSGAGLVVACGGDGTVTACAGALAGTAVPLLVVPCGTGNLLARNLGLPRDARRALALGLAAEPWAADLVLARADGMPDTYVTAMAGAGLDAEIMAAADRRLKNLIGWPAYGVAALRHLRAPRLRLTVSLDGRPPLERRARMVVAGNVGAIQGGLRLLPAARPDDGLLDLVLFDPRGPLDWLRALRVLTAGTSGAGGGVRSGEVRGPLEYLRAERVELAFGRSVRRELDGDPVPAGRTLRLDVRPGALLLRAPRPDPAPARPGDGAREHAVTVERSS
ncbi:diacylglycerol kinase family protein [Kitasatospora sp. NPDC057223]|uniref:diacylglycerol kinase family protein n=1 Tax=Kitasatospora sp. NPDC057223 TaxID=3346055 RepID=UPI00362E959B